MRPIRVYYHVYADGNWTQPASEFLLALKESGLEGEVGNIYIGLVGHPLKRDYARRWFEDRIPTKVVGESDTGWEQTTLLPLYEDACHTPEPYIILYAHTKGSSAPSMLNHQWRRDMVDELVYGWRKAVVWLDKYPTVGIYWMPKLRFFAGNFWWATSEFISDMLPPLNDSRHQAESWHRDRYTKGNFKFHDLRPGFPKNPSVFVSRITGLRTRVSEKSPELKRSVNSVNRSKEKTMIVTFRCDGKVGPYKPGRIYEDVLTPHLERLLRNGANLVLIDPPTLDPQPEPEPEPVVPVVVHVTKEEIEEIKYVPAPVEEVTDGESTDTTEGNTGHAGPSSPNRATKKSRERSEGSEELSSDSGRDEELS